MDVVTVETAEVVIAAKVVETVVLTTARKVVVHPHQLLHQQHPLQQHPLQQHPPQQLKTPQYLTL